MFIALVSDCYLPRLGGIEVQVAGLAGQLRSAGHTVVVLTATAGPRQAGVRRLDPPVSLGLPINPWAGPELRSVLARADVVHVHLGVLAPFAQRASTIALELGLPVVITWHSLVAGSPLTPLLARSWHRWLEQGAVPTAVSTVAARQVSEALGGSAVGVLRDGLDLERWRSPPNEASPSEVASSGRASRPGDGAVRVVSATRFAARKRPLRLLTMMSTVRRALSRPDHLRLTVLGDGPWLAPLRLMVDQCSMRTWVDLPGRVGRPELLRRYHHSDLYVAAARQEAFGIAALEARTTGLPVAGYADSGVADMVEQGRGGILAVDDADLVNRLARVIDDPGLLSEMATHHREHPLVIHDWSEVTEATLRTYRRLMVSR
ncbi:MAG: glycosyltransferase family 4 protein [Ornithinimicrobium sp.]